jgi:hypothetical protein
VVNTAVSNKLSSFILAENLKNKHVLSLHKFKTMFKDQVTLDVRADLVKRWDSVITKLDIKVPLALKREARLKYEKAITDVTLFARPTKLYSASELGRTSEVSPAVKVPHLLSKEERNLILKQLFDASEEAFKHVIATWRDAFMRERADGTWVTDFIIRRDERSIRLLLSSKHNGVEHETPLFYVSIEHGKAGSKTRAYDMVYLGVTS